MTRDSSFLGAVEERCVRFSAAPFLTHLPTGHELSYGELLALSRRLATVLTERTLKKQARILLVGRNDWLFHPLLLAAMGCGASLIPVDPSLHRDELAFIVDHSKPSLIVISDPRLTEKLPKDRVILTREQLLEQASSAAETALIEAGSEPGLIVYTSGTTSNGKGVVLTHDNLRANAVALSELYELTPSDRLYCVLPTYHMNAIALTGLIPMMAGAHVLMSDVFSAANANAFWRHLAEKRITVCSLTPSIMAMLLLLSPQGHGIPGLPLRFAFCGTAPLPEDLWRRFEKVFGIPVYQGYGLTETVSWATCIPPREHRKYDTVGVPVGCEIRIDRDRVGDADELFVDRRSARAGEPHEPERRRHSRDVVVGEVQIRGPVVMAGYFKDPSPHSTFTEDGFLRTGDVGFVDAEGYLHVIGRIKDVIIRNGVNISSREIDDVLRQLEGLEDAKTLGTADTLVGEKVVSACVMKPGTPEATAAAVRTHVTSRLSAHYVPDRVVFMKYLPRTGTGKVSVRALRSIVTGALSEEIYANISAPKYNREPPSDKAAIVAGIQDCLLSGEAIKFVAYWGAGNRGTFEPADKAALDRLSSFLAGANKLPEVSGSLTLVLADVHAIGVNGKPEAQCEAYFDEIARYATSLGFKTARLSDTWKVHAISLQDVIGTVSDSRWLAEWSALPIREKLVEQAGKHSLAPGDAEAAARLYYGSCQTENPCVEADFQGHVFLTYSAPEFDPILPRLPRMYLFSTDKWKTQKPWFS